jgi:hypothetical protein
VPATGTIEQLVKGVLQNDSTVYAACGTRVYIDTDLSAGFAVSDQYAVTVRSVGGSESESGTVQQVPVELQCYGPNQAGALAMVVAARAAVNGYSDGQLKRVEVSRPPILRRREGGLPYYELQVRVWYAV